MYVKSNLPPQIISWCPFKFLQCHRMYGHPREGALDLYNGAISEKLPKSFDLCWPRSTLQRFHYRWGEGKGWG